MTAAEFTSMLPATGPSAEPPPPTGFVRALSSSVDQGLKPRSRVCLADCRTHIRVPCAVRSTRPDRTRSVDVERGSPCHIRPCGRLASRAPRCGESRRRTARGHRWEPDLRREWPSGSRPHGPDSQCRTRTVLAEHATVVLVDDEVLLAPDAARTEQRQPSRWRT